MRITKREPTPGYCDANSVGTTKWAFGRKHGQKNRKTTLSPLVRLFLVKKRTVFFFGELVRWMLHIVAARHPGLGW